MTAPLRGIGTLWVEGALSFLEQMCLLSFVAQGHKVTLFHYGAIANAPEGIDLVDAREIHDPATIIYNRQFGTPVVQSDIFRLHMMMKTDLIWADTDVLCLKPFETPNGHFFGYQKKTMLCNAVMRLPASSPGLKDYIDYVHDEYPIPLNLSPEDTKEALIKKAEGKIKHASEQKHTVYGPATFTHFMQKSDEIAHAKGIPVFYPVPFKSAGEINDIHVKEFREKYIKEETLAVHLWGRRIRWWVAGKGVMRYSLLDRELRKLAVNPRSAPIILSDARARRRRNRELAS